MCPSSQAKASDKKAAGLAHGGFMDETGRGLRPSVHQFFDWSTSLFLAIQGIMARSSPPTTSIG
jgi:hypothetical protein